jgi:hypothetical protein
MGGGAVAAVNSFDAERCKLYTGRTTPAVILIAMVAASGGLLFGFDNGEAASSLQERCNPANAAYVIGYCTCVLLCLGVVEVQTACKEDVYDDPSAAPSG